MGVAAYSSALNVVPVPSGGNGSMGYAVCNPAGGGFVVATTANRAGGTVEIVGVALENFYSGVQFRVATSGYVPADVIGSLTGYGRYVSVDSTGRLYRSSSVTSDTIGTFSASDGSVFISTDYQFGGMTGNATSIQGISVTSASANKSWILAGDGANLRSRKDMPDTRDYGLAADGVTDDVAKLRTFATDVATYGVGHIHQSGSGILIGDTWELHDDTPSGSLRGIHLISDLADPFAPGVAAGYTFVNAVPCPSGSKAQITAYGNGGSGQNMQTVYLGNWSLGDYSGVQVTVATADKFVGRPVRLWYTNTKAHAGEFFITSVPADDTITIYQPNTGAGGSDANSGSIRFRIYRPMIDIRMREFRLEGMSFTAKSGAGKLGPLLEIGQPYRTGAVSVIAWGLERCAFHNAGSTSRRSRYGLQIAKQIVLRSGASGYVTNGAGVPQVTSTTQVDTGDLFRVNFFGMDEMCVCHSSPNAQSKEVTFRKCQFAPSGFNVSGYGGIGYGVPRQTFIAGGQYTVEGSPGVNFYDCSFGALDVGIQLGAGSSMPVDVHSCYWESTQRPLRAISISAPRPINLFGSAIAPTNTVPHPSRELMEIVGDGPLNLFGTNLQANDGSKYHMSLSGSSQEGKLGMYGAWFKGAPGWQGYRARVSSRQCGPYVFDSGDTLVFAVDGGADQTVTISVANFTAAGVVSADLNEVQAWQLGRLINQSVTGCAAWGDYDNALVVVESATEGAGSRIEFKSATGKAALIDFPTGVQAGLAQSAMSSATSGWIASARTSGAIPMAISSYGSIVTDYATSTVSRWWEGTKRFGTVFKNEIATTNSGTFTAVTGGAVTVAGAVVTVADTRVGASSVVQLVPTNAAAVALGVGYLSARTALTSFAFTFPGAPAGTETFTYSITDPT